jgi:nucleoside-diphosphate-sugar epimerase
MKPLALVTLGAGYLGSVLCEHLLKAGLRINAPWMREFKSC